MPAEWDTEGPSFDVIYDDTDSFDDQQFAEDAVVGVYLEADRSEANPGDDVRYWLRMKNLSNQTLPQWKIGFFFEPSQMQMLNAGGGRVEGDHVTFVVPAMRPNEIQSFTVRVHLYKKLRAGEVIKTYGSIIDGGLSGMICSKHELRIIARPPVTGAEDGTREVEDVRQYLRPVQSQKTGLWGMW